MEPPIWPARSWPLLPPSWVLRPGLLRPESSVSHDHLSRQQRLLFALRELVSLALICALFWLVGAGLIWIAVQVLVP